MSVLAVMRMAVCVAVCVWNLCACADTPLLSDSQVMLSDGTVLQGTSSGAVASFKGIRYAKPPIGALRWAPPQPYEYMSDEVVDATAFGSHCIQSVWPNGSEDCLFLNVFAPEDALSNPDTRLPVYVFIHGGSYISGSSKFYPGEDIVEYWGGQIIVVTLDYRLNVFGFIASEELRKQDPNMGSSGNYGLQDQRMCLQWIQKNIVSFGGDSSRVTLAGESAGGGSVSNHLTMKASWDLFAAAVVESGSFAQWTAQPMSRAQEVYIELQTLLNCSDLSCMLEKSTEEVYNAHISNTEANKYLSPYVPTVDGVEMTTHPWLALNTGDITDIPILHGTNADEGILFTCLDQRYGVSESELVTYWLENRGYSPREVRKLMDLYVYDKADTYPSTPHERITTTEWWALQRSTGDDMFSCPAKHASQQLARLQETGARKSNTSLYHFEYTSMMSSYAIHSAEMPYVFHWSLGTSVDSMLADLMSSYWGNFAVSATHDPNTISVGTPSLPYWASYTFEGDECLVIPNEQDISVVHGLKHDECEFHITHIDSSVRADFGSV
mmetsp:Transcript_6204/g.9354  ORF Transcript_6204/g.9354 Transcript_6204/m.9354 type:complete len:553 (+) Transcript_6204:108-1766(+)